MTSTMLAPAAPSAQVLEEEDTVYLGEIVIRAIHDSGAEDSTISAANSIGSRVPVDVEDQPRSVTIVPRELFEAQGACTMEETVAYTLPMVAALVAAPGIAQAQDTGVTDLGDIIFSSGPTPIEEENYVRSVSVITAEDIGRRGVRTPQDALRGVPSVAVNSTGESFTQIRIRRGDAASMGDVGDA